MATIFEAALGDVLGDALVGFVAFLDTSEAAAAAFRERADDMVTRRVEDNCGGGTSELIFLKRITGNSAGVGSADGERDSM